MEGMLMRTANCSASASGRLQGQTRHRLLQTAVAARAFRTSLRTNETQALQDVVFKE